MPLSKDEHLEITNKLGKCMEKLTPQEIPSFIYQLLKLCRFQNSKVIFLRLQNYFGSRVYQNTKTSDSESNSESMNLDVIGMFKRITGVLSTPIHWFYKC